MHIDTCTMLRSISRPRSEIIRRSVIRQRMTSPNLGLFMSLKNESAGSLRASVGTSATAVAARRRAGEGRYLAKLLAGADAASNCASARRAPAIRPPTRHLQNKIRLVFPPSPGAGGFLRPEPGRRWPRRGNPGGPSGRPTRIQEGSGKADFQVFRCSRAASVQA